MNTEQQHELADRVRKVIVDSLVFQGKALFEGVPEEKTFEAILWATLMISASATGKVSMGKKDFICAAVAAYEVCAERLNELPVPANDMTPD